MVIASDDNGQDSSGSGDSGSSEDGSAGGIFKNILYLCLFFFFWSNLRGEPRGGWFLAPKEVQISGILGIKSPNFKREPWRTRMAILNKKKCQSCILSTIRMHVSYAIFVALLRDQMAKTWKTMFQGKRKDKTYLLKRTIIYVLVFGTGILVLGRNLTSNGRNVYTIYIFAKKKILPFHFYFLSNITR